MSLGAANVFHQASILELYDPERTKTVLRAGEVSSWDEFMADLVNALAEQRPKQGAGLRLLTGTVTSPTLLAQIDALLKKYPKARWHAYEPWKARDLGVDNVPHYDFSKAKVIVALDSDFLFSHPASLAYARQFAKGRDAGQGMNRLYVAEPTPSITGTMADHRLPCGAREIVSLVSLLGKLTGTFKGDAKTPGGAGIMTGSTETLADQALSSDLLKDLPAAQRTWLEAVVTDLHANKGACLVLAGEGQPAIVHLLISYLNDTYASPELRADVRLAERRGTAHPGGLSDLFIRPVSGKG